MGPVGASGGLPGQDGRRFSAGVARADQWAGSRLLFLERTQCSSRIRTMQESPLLLHRPLLVSKVSLADQSDGFDAVLR